MSRYMSQMSSLLVSYRISVLKIFFSVCYIVSVTSEIWTQFSRKQYIKLVDLRVPVDVAKYVYSHPGGRHAAKKENGDVCLA